VELLRFAGSLRQGRELVSGRPLVRDRPAEREPLLRLDTVLQALELCGDRP
jgi:hypothetical protein